METEALEDFDCLKTGGVHGLGGYDKPTQRIGNLLTSLHSISQIQYHQSRLSAALAPARQVYWRSQRLQIHCRKAPPVGIINSTSEKIR
jgi:hypothetical protein